MSAAATFRIFEVATTAGGARYNAGGPHVHRSHHRATSREAAQEAIRTCKLGPRHRFAAQPTATGRFKRRDGRHDLLTPFSFSSQPTSTPGRSARVHLDALYPAALRPGRGMPTDGGIRDQITLTGLTWFRRFREGGRSATTRVSPFQTLTIRPGHSSGFAAWQHPTKVQGRAFFTDGRPPEPTGTALQAWEAAGRP